jgi:cyclase
VRHLTWCLGVLLIASTVRAQEPDPAKVEIKVEKVAGSVFLLTGAGGNIAISAGDDGVLVVDAQFASLGPKLQAAIKGVTDEPVRFVLDTHWHQDHTSGNATFAGSAVVVAHDNVRRRLSEGFASFLGRPLPPAPKEQLPLVTFDHGISFHMNGEAVRAVHYGPGHTSGDAVVFFPKSNVVHLGDQFVTYGLPFVDVQDGGTLLGMIRNVERAMSEVPDDVKVIPGHGPLSGKADVKKYTDMLHDCVSLVQAAIRQGRTLEQMKAENVLAKYDALGQGFIKTPAFVELIYRELSGSEPGAGPLPAALAENRASSGTDPH